MRYNGALTVSSLFFLEKKKGKKDAMTLSVPDRTGLLEEFFFLFLALVGLCVQRSVFFFSLDLFVC